MSTAAVLLSGGLDSATAASWAQAAGYEVAALSVDYGQRHRGELEAAARVAAQLRIAVHRTVRIDLRAVGGSALTADIAVPRDREEIGSDVPPTYVPARNLTFLAVLAGFAETLDATDLVIGANVQDSSGYPDCRPEFLAAFATVATLGTTFARRGRAFVVHAPLIHLSKAGIVRLGASLGVEYGATLSCYDPPASFVHCGHCDACRLRRAGFAEAEIADPSVYAG